MRAEKNFERAVVIVQGLPKEGEVRPTQEEQLAFYKYYKQGRLLLISEGDGSISRNQCVAWQNGHLKRDR